MKLIRIWHAGMAGVLLFAGCNSHGQDSKSAGAAGAGASNEPPSLAAHVQRGKEIQKVQNDLRQISLFYQTYLSDRGRAPANAADFAAYIQRDAPNEAQAIKDGKIVLTFINTMSAQKVLAYEKQPDLRGNQRVVMGDGSVRNMAAPELLGALRGQGAGPSH